MDETNVQIEMTIPEFLNFKKTAIAKGIKFLCYITPLHTYMVTTDQEFLNFLGF